MTHWINKLEAQIGEEYTPAVVQLVAFAALAVTVVMGNWHILFG